MFKCRKYSAFTLVELLVVIAIVGLLSTIVLAVTSGVSEQGRIAKSLQFSKHLENSLGDHLVGRWTFDETADLCGTNKVCDTSGWNNHGTMNNFVLPYGLVTDTPSGQGKAMSFDGVDDYVNCGANESLSPDYITIELWVKPNTGYGYTHPRLYAKGDSKQYRMTTTLEGRLYSYLDIEGVERNINVVGALEENVWQYFVVTFDGTTHVLYKNGQVIGNDNTYQGKLISSDGLTSHNLLVGGYADRMLDGLIDEVRIYSTALTALQIQSHYYAGLNKLLANKQITEQEYQQRLTKN